MNFNNFPLFICPQHWSTLWVGGARWRLQSGLKLLCCPDLLHMSLLSSLSLCYWGMFFSWSQIAHELRWVSDASNFGSELTDILLVLPISYWVQVTWTWKWLEKEKVTERTSTLPKEEWWRLWNNLKCYF